MLLASTTKLRLVVAVRIEQLVVEGILVFRKNDGAEIAEARAGGLAERVHDEFFFLAGAG